MTQELSFDQLPKAVSLLTKEVRSLKDMLSKKQVQPKAIEEAEKLMNIEEAAKFLNLTKPTIYSKVSKREIPFMKRGNRLYFSSIELMEYIKQGNHRSNSVSKAVTETAKRKEH